MNENNILNQEQQEPQKPKSNVKKIIFAIIAAILASVIGRFVGHFAVDTFSNASINNKIDEFIESMNEYEPGVCDEDTYVSTAFGLNFSANENWIMYTEDELQAYTDAMKTSAVLSGEKAMKDNNVSDELAEKWKSSVYAKAEMGAACVSDFTVVGEAVVFVYSSYGISDLSREYLVEELSKQLSEMADADIEAKDETIAGETYVTGSVTTNIDGLKLQNKLFIREKDGMICMMICKSLEGYEWVQNDFVNQFSTID